MLRSCVLHRSQLYIRSRVGREAGKGADLKDGALTILPFPKADLENAVEMENFFASPTMYPISAYADSVSLKYHVVVPENVRSA